MTDRRLLRRTQWWTLGGGFAVGVVVALIASLQHGLGVAVGTVWAALNLRVMEGLIMAALVPRDRPRDLRAVFIWSILKLGVYVLAVWLLVVAPFPVVGMAQGLTIMLAALVLAGLTTRPETVRESPRRGDDDSA
jgi:hypothetical protein